MTVSGQEREFVVTISVITIVRDHESGLAKTYQSLLKQDFSNWEMIIIVGESKDNTLEYARKLQLNDKRIHVVAQHGLGIYAAMNEGLKVTSRKFIWFMNAGDKFKDSSVINNAINEVELHNAAIVIGGYQVDSEGAAQIYSLPFRRVSKFSFAFSRRGGCHQAMIFRNQALQAAGGFNVCYSLAGDFDMVLRILKSKKVVRVPAVYASIEPGGRADKGIVQVYKEKHDIRKEVLGGPFVFFASITWTLLACIKKVYKLLKVS